MHFDRALVSSLLFISAVLSAEPGTWGGAMFAAKDAEHLGREVTYVEGTFNVPFSYGEIGSGFAIGVSLDGLTCNAALAAGVSVSTSNNGVDIEAFGQFWPIIDERHPDPQSFIISPGNTLKISVSADTVYNPVYGFSVENMSTRKSWSGAFATVSGHPLCKQNAYWVVTMLSNGWPLARFNPVTFTDLQVKRGSDPRPQKPSHLAIINIVQNNRDMTSVRIKSSNVIIEYKSSGC